MLICFGFLTSIAVFCDAIFSDLADATERRHFNTLDSALKRTHESKFEPKLKATTKKAQTVRDEVYSNWIHEELEMKQTTVAELKSYRNPPPAIFDTMQAVFILLGENGKSLNVIVLISVYLSNSLHLLFMTNFNQKIDIFIKVHYIHVIFLALGDALLAWRIQHCIQCRTHSKCNY